MELVNESKLVAKLSQILALECGLNAQYASRIKAAAALHDIGKSKIPLEILNKPGKFNAHDYETMKTHTTAGAKILSSIQGELGIMARTVCEYHHEWYNGDGYWGKSSQDLPEYVSIISISDVFVALISKRVYKSPWPPVEVLEYLQKQAGTQFCPKLVETFISLIQNNGEISSLFCIDGYR